MQFPPSFKAREGSLESLERYLAQFREYPPAVELRHRSWAEMADRFKETFASLNVSWVFIDEPKFSSSIRQDIEPTGDTLYVRFHGRNKAKWWKHDQAWERYDYLYKRQEFLPFAEEFQRLVKEGLMKCIYVYFNNHARVQAVANALILKLQLGLPIETAALDTLREAFPELKALLANTAPSTPRNPTPPDTQGSLPL
jgi:uncharacterized protein YecE (DUF72 family)